ncbi:HD domain-containing phosphohydrolase [Halopseudomonas maritima]|uniref:HD domain-containing phosphohydrolase n=1 Tax=Halopseudomonas maritima TaxID=2918528 RepID=UPI001EEC4967|nr:HD domain-containing phosphohydrolase [Halopseudomonas maritima]UJJ31029.1 phosphohydrolase [Halopseudomonas maritima]
MKKAHTWISLQGLIPATIVVCLLAMLAVTALHGYRGARAVLVAAASDSARQIGSLLDERAGRLISPGENALRLLEHDPLASADSLRERLSRLPALAELLNNGEAISAVYAGYPNGEFFLARRVPEGATRKLQLPNATQFLVQSIERDGDQIHGRWLFYDAALHQLGSRPMPQYRFDPRTRPWYQLAQDTDSIVLTQPYLFFTTGQVGLTMAVRSPWTGAVLGLDAAVDDLAVEVNDMHLTPGSEMAIVSGQRVVAYPDLERLIVRESDGEPRLAMIDELQVPVLSELAALELEPSKVQLLSREDGDWYVISLPLARIGGEQGRVLIAMPGREMLSGVVAILRHQAIWALVLMLLLVLVGWAVGQRLGGPLRQLADQVGLLANMDFSQKVVVRSRIREVSELSATVSRMAGAINNFQEISLALSRETRLERMLDVVLERLIDMAKGRGGAVFLCDEEASELRLASGINADHYPQVLPLDESLLHRPARVLATRLDREHRYLTLALRDRQEVLLGVLAVEVSPSLPSAEVNGLRQFLDTLSGTLAVAIETRQLFADQQLLLEAMIRLLATAIDAKSPYTGGHCDRVPQLAEMLLNRAIADDTGALADFSLSDEQRYAFRIAAWMHDCGKITSPEYVVDKATKLETLYNRIHEVRTRFEVLWRDADVRYWQGLAQGLPADQLAAEREQTQTRLQAEFAAVAKANVGGEFMQQADIEQLHEIGQQTWLRHFDNRLGLSHQELRLLEGVPSQELPAVEALLADRPEHKVPWGERKPPVTADDPDNRWGFDMALPEYSFNLGELHNLQIQRGTLTAEERFKINEHIVQTLIMLSTLPFPRHLKGVPDLAATHHEKLDGTGYPRRLGADQLRVEDRVLAIADIFEALTAADRPYKSAKTLSEAVRIMLFMAKDRHIDGDLLALFLRTGVHQQYGQLFLQPEQCDDVDVPACLAQLREWGVLSEEV